MSDFDYGKIKPGGQYERYPSSVKLNDRGEPDFKQPHRSSYKCRRCGTVTHMRSASLTLTYATNPGYYGLTFCCGCHDHLPLTEFDWQPDGVPMTEVSGEPGKDLRLF